MRLYLKRFIWLIFGAFLCSFLMLNYLQLKYARDLPGFVDTEEPWGVNFDVDHHHGRIKATSHGNMLTDSSLHNQANISLPLSLINDLKSMWPVVNKEETRDRIVEQLYKYKSPVTNTKTIAIVGGNNQRAQERLLSEKCPVTQCKFVKAKSARTTADAVVFFGSPGSSKTIWQRPPNQIWAMYQLESPHHSSSTSFGHSTVNWTATYRRDSVIVTPYEKFVPFDNFTMLTDTVARNYSEGKSKLVAWFVSNCNAANGRRNYVAELKKYIIVDVYGGCGTHKCPRSNSKECFDLLKKDYKFYLSFENSNCKDYITEKFYWNGLGNDIVPVVMGAHPNDYMAVAPPESYIHVDHFESPKDLAAYLHKLDRNPDLYNSYFRWKGTGEFINTKFWCRLCNMVHAADLLPHRAYIDVNKWWRGDICVKPGEKRYSTWKNIKQSTAFWENNTVLYQLI